MSINILTDYEVKEKIKPRSFWVIIILYSLSLIITYIYDFAAFKALGFQNVLFGSKTLLFLLVLDISQVLILISFFNKLKFAWSLLIVMQSLFFALYLKLLYQSAISQDFTLTTYGSSLSIYYTLNSGILISLTIQKVITKHFQIANFLKITTLVLSLTAACLVLLYYNG